MMPVLSQTEFHMRDLLEQRSLSHSEKHLLFFSFGNTSEPSRVSYGTLYSQAKKNAALVRAFKKFQEEQPILLYLDNHYDTILWFWSILFARGLPVISTLFSRVDEHRHKHIWSLSSLLKSPICITRKSLIPSFDSKHTFELHTIETLLSEDRGHDIDTKDLDVLGERQAPDMKDHKQAIGEVPAFLMLTSGSTGDAKAVCFSSRQVLAAVKGKAATRLIPSEQPLLNWIGLDHVASLVEIHVLALWLGISQIHVHAADIVSSPTTFLDLLSKHRVSRSFAPNFFLAKLVSAIENSIHHDTWDLSRLSMITSGGESNNVQTCVAASLILEKHGAPPNVITPGFGMTETCAGAIFNLSCPKYDVENCYEVSSLGQCMEGIEMRVTVATSEGGSRIALPNEIGNLELQGDVVFDSYYQNPIATSKAFTSDHWFITGDQAYIDVNGHLKLTGRTKDITNINGVKIPSSEIQWAIEQALGESVTRVLSFPSRAADSEQITVTYIPHEWPMPIDKLIQIDRVIEHACVMCAGHPPVVFALRKDSISLLPTSTLGKVSRSRMRSLFELGIFQRDLDFHVKAIKLYKKVRQQIYFSSDEVEAGLAKDFAHVLKLESSTFAMEDSLFELGCTSMDLVKLRYRIESRLGLTVPVLLLMKHPTVRSLGRALRLDLSPDPGPPTHTTRGSYDPVIVMRSTGTKAPLWLIHPGVGEVLVFVGLAQQLKDDCRPIYALRARGFEPGEESFVSVTETVQTYIKAIRQRQPRGPYALAGYSYGAMLAFEVAKHLESEDGTSSVRFLGSFNLPPHIKSRMRYLNWNMCLLHLAYFLGLITETSVDSHEAAGFRAILHHNEAVDLVFDIADRSRMEELQLGKPELARWADVAFGLQSMAVDYEPHGFVENLDVFHALPLRVAAASSEEWLNKHLSEWKNFCRTEPRFHRVGGAHYTMLGPNHISSFCVTLQNAMQARGV